MGLGLFPFLNGCSSTSPHTHSGDPLFGEYYPKGPNGQPMPPPSQGANKTTSLGVPPYPAANSASSTAAIAGNAALPGGRPLAINEKSGTNWALTNTSTTNTPATGNGQPVVQPIPPDTTGPITAANQGAQMASIAPINIGEITKPATPVVAAASWSKPTPIQQTATPIPPLGKLTPEVLQSTLEAKGAIGLKQEAAEGGSVRVSCYVQQKTNPANMRYLETVAADYPTALQALLRQVDQ